MRRTMLVVATMALIVSAASGVALAATIIGTPGDDNEFTGNVLMGTGDADTIKGLGGRDRILGCGGSDTLFGGPGNDAISGELSERLLWEDNGYDCPASNDETIDETRADTIVGGRGMDIVSGGIGNDVLFGNAGRDSLSGCMGTENDCGSPNSYTEEKDKLFGGPRRDILDGEGGRDELYGGRGDDYLHTGENYEEEGSDEAVDYADCGPGEDTVRYEEALDYVAANCEHKVLMFPSSSSSASGG